LLLLPTAVIGLGFVQELIHSMGHSDVSPSWFAKAMGERGPMSLVAGMALVSWFALDEWLLRKRIADSGVRAWRSTLKAFLCIALLTLVGIGLFWVLDGLRLYLDFTPGNPFVACTLIAVASLLAGVAVSVYALAGGKWASSIALAAAVAVSLVQVAYVRWLNDRLGWGFDMWRGYPVGQSWFTVAIICFAAGLASLTGLLEYRAFANWRRTASLVFVFLWGWVVAQNAMVIMPWHHLCYHILSPEEERIQEVGRWLIGGAWVVAVVVRVLWHRASRHAVKEERPAASTAGQDGFSKRS
jgi:hypothetical protein